MRAVQTVIPVTIILVLILGGVWFIMLRMPGKRYQGPMPSLTEEQRLLREMLRKDVYKLADEIATAMSERITKIFVLRLILLRHRCNRQDIKSIDRAMK